MACFISVANNLNISRAAREMFISQPAMTVQMNSLEEELDTKLIIRDRRKIELTPMGIFVAQEFRRILDELEHTKLEVKSIEKSAYGKLRIGFHGPAEWAHVHLLIMQFKRVHPDIDLEIVIDTWDSLRDSVNQRALDAVFIPLCEVKGLVLVETEPMFRDYLCIVVSRLHPLANRRSVRIDEIASESFILPDYGISPTFLHYFDHQMQKAGLKIRNTGQGNYSEATITLAASGLGMTMMPRSFKTASHAVAYVDLDFEDVVLDIVLAWHAQDINTALPRFVEFCRSWNWQEGNMLAEP